MYRSRPYPNGWSGVAARAARLPPTSSSTWLPESATEWIASASIEDAPVTRNAMNFAVAVLARAAAASVDDVGAAAGRASIKAAGVVVDDTAVTPQYVQGLAAERELPIVRRIAVGSLRNKLLIILPVALLLSEVVPWL